MIDIQNEKEERGIPLQYAGVSDLRTRLSIADVATIGKVRLGVSLKEDARGIHMSRLSILLDAFREVNNESIRKLLKNAADAMESSNARLELESTLFLSKEAPVSGLVSEVPYDIRIEASLNSKIIHILSIPITTLCPCSKAISEYGAHNQRGIVKLKLKDIDVADYACIIRLIEKEVASSELYEVLRRPDEKAVTERAYENPRFVEDIARETILVMRRDYPGKLLSVEAVNDESIHSHNAYVYTEFV